MKKTVYIAFLFCATGILSAADDVPRKLTLRQAEEIAIAQHPRISVANLEALAAQQVVSEVRAPFFPTIYANATAVGVADTNNTRIAAGLLNNPNVYERNAEGVSISQLITDFGRTWDLTKSAKLNQQAEEMNRVATRSEILLEVDAAYFAVLQAQAVLEAALQTEKSRASVLQQTQGLATNKIKSDLDSSFASVDLGQAKLLAANAQNNVQAAFANLVNLLGERDAETFDLAEEPEPAPMTNDASELVLEALANRPDLARSRYKSDAAKEFALAEKKLGYPTISAMASGGIVPLGDPRLGDNYGAAGVNLSFPIFTGGLFKARQREADYRAEAATEGLRDEENTIVRDVRVSKLTLDYSFERLALARELLDNANKALELAQARFNLGVSSIVELSQAELNQTSAQIEEAGAKYNCQIQHSSLEFQLGRLR